MLILSVEKIKADVLKWEERKQIWPENGIICRTSFTMKQNKQLKNWRRREKNQFTFSFSQRAIDFYNLYPTMDNSQTKPRLGTCQFEWRLLSLRFMSLAHAWCVKGEKQHNSITLVLFFIPLRLMLQFWSSGFFLSLKYFSYVIRGMVYFMLLLFHSVSSG